MERIDMARIPMDEKELREARRVGVPERIVGKMAVGIEPNEKEKEIIKKLGKVYVEAHKKDGRWVKPQLRELPGGRSQQIGTVHNSIDKEKLFKKDVEEVEEEYEESRQSPAIYGFDDWMDVIDKEDYDALINAPHESQWEEYEYEYYENLSGGLEESCMNYMYGKVDEASDEFEDRGFKLINTLSGDYSYDKILERDGKKVRVSTSPHGQDYSWDIQIEEEEED